MARSDEAAEVIAAQCTRIFHASGQHAREDADGVLAATLPDGRTVGQALDDLDPALRTLGYVVDRSLLHLPGRGWQLADWSGEPPLWQPLADVDPEAAALLQRIGERPS